MRPLPETMPPTPAEPGLAQGYIRQVRSYELITPLFGGGVEPQQYDPISVVRASEVRGQLRFWWRATRGGVDPAQLTEEQQENSKLLENMKEREGAIWGLASQGDSAAPSQVQVEIRSFAQPQRFVVRDQDGKQLLDKYQRPIHVGAPGSPYGYAGFPLYQAKPKQQAYEQITFDLIISFPEKCKEDVEAALWAWETFGGIGGRTRRGFGALQLIRAVENDQEQVLTLFPATAQETESQIKARVKEGTWPANVPYLSVAHIRVVGQVGHELDIWAALLKALKQFRHQRPGGRGRNRWPEPDAIRKLTKRQRSKNVNTNTLWIYNPVIECFPRAVFGLPIQYQFKEDDQADGDPLGSNRLVGRDEKGELLDRLGSPLILRPIPCEGGALGLAAILQGIELPAKLVIELTVNGVKEEHSARGVLTANEADQLRTATNKVLLPKDRTGKTRTDILQIFFERLSI
jgi:CRISPR-associated protein Cmr1